MQKKKNVKDTALSLTPHTQKLYLKSEDGFTAQVISQAELGFTRDFLTLTQYQICMNPLVYTKLKKSITVGYPDSLIKLYSFRLIWTKIELPLDDFLFLKGF